MSRRGARLGPKIGRTQEKAVCQIVVFGMEMTCPICRTVVASGTSHRCTRAGAVTKIETVTLPSP